MGKLRNKSQQGYTIIANNILQDKELSIKERGLLCTLLSLPDGWDYSVRGLAKILPDGKAAIGDAVKRLEEKGYIRRIQAKNKQGLYSGYEWEVSDNRLPENRSTENQSTRNQSTENQAQLIKQKENTKKSINNTSINQSIELKNYIKVKEDLKQIIGWEGLKDELAKDVLEVAIEEIAANKPTVKIGNKEVPTSIFASKIKKLYYEDINRIADSIGSQTTEIKNPRAYILAALYNEDTTSNLYWRNRVNVDMG